MTPTGNPNDMPTWLEDAWLERYLERRLSDAEAAWFEAYLLSRPRLVERLEADNDLRDGYAAGAGIAVAASTGSLAIVSPDDPRPAQFEHRAANPPARRPAFAMSGFALAASVAVAGLLGALTAARFPPGGAADAVAIASPPRVVFDTMRGEASDAVLHAGNSVSRFVLIEVSLPASARDAIFVGADGLSLPVSPGIDGFASVLVPSAGLIGATAPRLRYSVDGRVVERVLEADYAGLLAPR
jgi:hypothetical protein